MVYFWMVCSNLGMGQNGAPEYPTNWIVTTKLDQNQRPPELQFRPAHILINFEENGIVRSFSCNQRGI